MKRFWREAASGPAEGGGHAVCLDGRPVRTPAGKALVVPGPALAAAIAAEWGGQGHRPGAPVRPQDMPLTQLACTALDRIAADPAATAAAIARFAETDLLCYRAEEPEALIARQRAIWQPVLDWLAQTYDAPLGVTAGLMPLAQERAALEALGRVVARIAPLPLAGLSLAVGAMGSLALGLALLAGRLDAEAAADAALLDETFQAERWGSDPEAEARRAQLRADVAAAARLFALLRTDAVPFEAQLA
ncbi:MAG: ATPase [Alphaproteobacteria bacterium]|nr:ATPase [Alphaproteobacteria bacterium]